MRRTILLWLRVTWRSWVLLAAAVLVIRAGAQQPARQAAAPRQADTARQTGEIDPTRIEGHEKCVDCHKTELRAWSASKHSTRAFDLLRAAPTALEYATKLGITPENIARKSLCVECHATPQHDAASGRVTVLPGVSCETCHNPSGGTDGWLNAHAVYGPPGTKREEESPAHYEERMARCREAGQLRTSDLYLLAKRCFSCHVVDDEKLAQAGHEHPKGDFELVEKSLGEVRHNFFIDPAKNAQASTLWIDPLRHSPGRSAAGRMRAMFVVGKLVDLETSLRSLATATKDDDFSSKMEKRISKAFAVLSEDLLAELKRTKLGELEQLVKDIQPTLEKLGADGFSTDDRRLYLEAAGKVARAATQFADRDGSELGELDELDLIPKGPFDGVFQP
ncbi:MAG: hypothetical protein HYS13_15870 [Planctomycetia bacterium]|nr:hypothetical protein [Planctomycetia bacterium]